MTRAKANRMFRPVARRDLKVERSRAKVVVEIGKPYPGDRCYACPIRFTLGRRSIRLEALGVDPFQALDLAIKRIGIELRYGDTLPVGRMYAFEKGDDMGFPEPYK